MHQAQRGPPGVSGGPIRRTPLRRPAPLVKDTAGTQAHPPRRALHASASRRRLPACPGRRSHRREPRGTHPGAGPGTRGHAPIATAHATGSGDRRQLVLPVATTIFAGRDGVIIRYGGTVDYRPTSQAIEAETYGRQDTGNGSGQGWDERAFSAQVAEWAIAVAGETGASVAHSAGSLRRGVGG